MENASKALLIAAAVLIVILIITMGIIIIKPTEEISDNAETVGESIKESTQETSQQAISEIIIKGDLDGDRKVTQEDLKIWNEKAQNESNDPKYDVNGDGAITLADKLELKSKIENK